MRVLWLAPWFRTLAVAWAEGLRHLGHEVAVVTTPMHFDAPSLHPADFEFTTPWRSGAGMSELATAKRRVVGFRPEVAIVEPVRDPRFLALLPAGVPVVLTTHDHKPHDAANAVPWMRRINAALLQRRCRLEVAFSHAVANQRNRGRHPVITIPLTSEMPESLTPAYVPAEERRDFILVGRISAYKNLPLAIDAYRLHKASDAFRGDRLLILGDGQYDFEIPPGVEWQRGRFRFADLAPRIASAKASLCLYSAGSQSGVQVLNMQCGVVSLVSSIGGLPSYLPVGEVPLASQPEAVAAALGRYADPAEAAAAGGRNQAEYQRRYAVAPTSAAWARALASVVDAATVKSQ